MEIMVSVGGVDGETNVTMCSPRPEAALKFLAQNDHEGSSIGLTIRVYDEQAWRLLEALVKLEAELKAIHEGV